jgi:DNA polymerase-3 subunit gamma/tau
VEARARADTRARADARAAGGHETQPPPPETDPPPATEIAERPAARAREGARELESVRALWPAVIDLVRGANAMLAALIEQAQPVALDGEQLTVAFPSSASFLKKKAEAAPNRATVVAALGDLAGGRWRLVYELREELDVRESDGAAPRSEQEWVARFMEEFDAEELPPEPNGDAEVGVSERRGG